MIVVVVVVLLLMVVVVVVVGAMQVGGLLHVCKVKTYIV